MKKIFLPVILVLVSCLASSAEDSQKNTKSQAIKVKGTHCTIKGKHHKPSIDKKESTIDINSRNIRRAIRNEWHPVNPPKKNIVFSYSLMPPNKVKDLKLVSSSGSPKDDSEAMSALKNSLQSPNTSSRFFEKKWNSVTTFHSKYPWVSVQLSE
ncbi:MAG: hypothetical protein KDE33_25465 [Bacteroidetes bacterium]|nr:hypothetical protein [Bacteroidota bacterium]